MKMLINGKHVDSVSGKTFNNYNPYNGELVCTVPAGTKEDYEMFKMFWPNFIAKVLTKFYKNSEKSNKIK